MDGELTLYFSQKRQIYGRILESLQLKKDIYFEKFAYVSHSRTL